MPAFVQAKNANATSTDTIISVTPTGNVTINNILFVGAEYSTGSTETATIANTGTGGAVIWNALAKFTTSGTGNVLDYFGWWGIAPATGTCIPTVTFSASNSARGIVFGEWSPDTGKIWSKQDGATVQTNKSTASTTLAGSAITPTDTNDIIVAFYKGGGTLSALASGWNDRTMNATLLCGLADCIPGSTSAQTFSATQTSSRGMIQEFSFLEGTYFRPLPVAVSSSTGSVTAENKVGGAWNDATSTWNDTSVEWNSSPSTLGGAWNDTIAAWNSDSVPWDSSPSAQFNPVPSLSSSSAASSVAENLNRPLASSLGGAWNDTASTWNSASVAWDSSPSSQFNTGSISSSTSASSVAENLNRPLPSASSTSTASSVSENLNRPLPTAASSSTASSAVENLPNPSASSSSSSTVTTRFRFVTALSASSSATTKDRNRIVSTSSSSSVSVVVDRWGITIVLSSASACAISAEDVFKSHPSASSLSSGSSSNHIETQVNPGAIGTSGSASATSQRAIYLPPVIAASSCSCVIVPRQQSRPGSIITGSSASSVEIRQYFAPLIVINESSSGNATSRNAYRPIPYAISPSSVSEILVLNTPVVLTSSASATSTNRQQLRSIPACGSASTASGSVHLIDELAALVSSSSLASSVDRLAFRSLPGSLSSSSSVSNTEGNITRPLAVASSASMSTARVTPAITALILESSSSSISARSVSRISTQASAASTAAINLVSIITVPIVSSSSVAQTDRTLTRASEVASSESSATVNVSKVSRFMLAVVSLTNGTAINRNLARALTVSVSTSRSTCIFETGLNTRSAPGCVSLTKTDIYLALSSTVPPSTSTSGVSFVPMLHSFLSGASSSSASVNVLQRARPRPSESSSSSAFMVIPLDVPITLSSASSVALNPVLVAPVTSVSSSSGSCVSEQCLNSVPNGVSASSAIAYPAFIYPVTSISRSTLSDIPKNLVRTGAIILQESGFSVNVELVEAPIISQTGLSLSSVVSRLRIELVPISLSSSASTVVVRQGANVKPAPTPKSSSIALTFTSVVIPVSGNFVSTCTAITRSRTLTLSVSNSSGVVTSRTVIKPGPGLISASSGVSNAEVVTSSSFIARIQTIATSSSAFGVQPETQFEIISQSYSSSGGALIIDDETMVLSKCASICTASPELLARPQPKASSSGKCVTTHPINSQMEIAVQLETDSELVIEEVGTQLEFMAQGECDSLVIINVEYLEAIVSEMIAAADSVSSSYLVPRGIVTFVGAAINSAGSRTVTIPSLGNDSSEEFLTV